MIRLNLIGVFQKYAPIAIALTLLCGTILSFILFTIDKISISYHLLFVIADIVFILYHISEKKRVHTLDNQVTSSNTNYQSIHHPSYVGRFLDLLYIALIISILWILQIFEIRPLGYFVLMSILAGCVAISIICGYDKAWKSLGKISLLSIIATFSIFKVYYWVGYDNWTHASLNEVISHLGTLDFLNIKQMGESIQHVSVAITDILIGVDIRMATFMAISLPLLTVASLSVYIIVNKLTNQKSALLATLLFVYLPPVILWAQLGETTSEGFILATLILLIYTIWKYSANQFRKRLFILLLIVEFCICINHTFSAFIVFIIILALYIGSVIRDNQYRTEELLLFILYSISLGIYWIFSNILKMVVSIAESSLDFSNRVSPPTDIEKYINIIPPTTIETVLDMSFLVVLVICVLLLCLIMTKQHRGFSKNIWAYLIIGITLTLGYCISNLVLAEMALRFNAHCAFLLAIIFGCLLFFYQQRASDIWRKNLYHIIVVLLIVSIGFLGLGNTAVNDDNPIWKSDSYVSWGVTVAEADALETVVAFLPDLNTTVYDDKLSPAYGYYSHLQMFNDMNVAPQSLYYTPVYLDWFELSNSNGENLLFRTKLLTKPATQRVIYGNEFGERLSIAVQLTEDYANQLDYNYMKTYSNDALDLIPLI